jgi:thiol-disulfide isomerase/thioredoxin
MSEQPPTLVGPAGNDAPTTSPSPADGAPRAPSTLVARVGGVLAQPRRTFAALTRDDDAGLLEPLLVYAVVVWALHAADTYRLLALVQDAPLVVARRLVDLVVRAGSADLIAVTVAAVAAAAAVVVAAVVAGAANGGVARRALAAAVATAYLLVPLAVVKGVGGALAFAGLDVWWLPHHAVDSFVVVVDRAVSPARVLGKAAVAWGPGLVVLLAWMRDLLARRSASDPPSGTAAVAPAPRLPAARAGLAVVVVAVCAVVACAVVDVLARKESLRPRLAGDAFPTVPLRALPGVDAGALVGAAGAGPRVDLRALARAPTTRVLVVDFWASWCGPCRRSLPDLAAFAARRAQHGVVVVGVNREPGDVAAAQKAWRELAPGLPSLVDDRGLGEKLGLTSLPSSFVVDQEGTIRALHLGYTPIAALEDDVEEILREAR